MGLTGILLTDADARQEFVNILSNDVIKPLEILKVSQEDLVLAGIPVLNGRVIRKEAKDNTRSYIKKNLKISASIYAHAEKRVSKLQQEYLKKNRSRQYAYSANVSQRPQGVTPLVADSNKRFGRRMSALFRGQRESQREPGPAPSEEGIANVTIRFQLGLPNQCLQCPMMYVEKLLLTSTSFEYSG